MIRDVTENTRRTRSPAWFKNKIRLFGISRTSTEQEVLSTKKALLKHV